MIVESPTTWRGRLAHRLQLMLPIVIIAMLLALLPHAPTAQAASLVEVTNFGTNPTNLRMHLYVPDNVRPNPPILLAVHYCTGTGQAFYSGTEFASLSNQYGFIVIYPTATRNGACWDVSSSQALRRDGGSDPVGLMSMVRYVLQNRNADPNRIYVTGASSGAMMTNVLLGNYPDVFKAGAAFMGVPHSCFTANAGDPTNPANQAGWNSTCAQGQSIKTAQEWGNLVRGAYPGYTGPRPRMQIWHGTNDDILRYPNFGEQIKQWTNVHGLSQTATETVMPGANWTRTRYADSAGTVQVEAHSLQGAGHNLPMSGQARLAIEFFGLHVNTPPPTNTPTRTSTSIIPSITRTSTSIIPSITRTSTSIIPSNTPTSTSRPASPTSTATTVPAPNMLKNGSFEVDGNGDGRPDSWSGSNAVAASSYARSNVMKYGPYGTYSLRHRSTSNASYMVTQVVTGIQAGQAYRVSGWTNIPSTGDAFTYRVEVVWRNANNQNIGTQLVKGYTAPTNGWNFAGADYVAPTGATNAVVRMNVADLNATIYADVFNFRPAATTPPTQVPATPTTQVPATPTAGPAFALRIDAGATVDYTDGAGNVWAADTGFAGGTALDRSTLAIANTEDDRLYQTERYGMTGYAVSVPNGTYTVRLHLAETYEGITAPGQRVFSVSVEGTTLANIDVYAEAGGRDSALVKTVVVTVADGVLNLDFTATANNALLNGLEIFGS